MRVENEKTQQSAGKCQKHQGFIELTRSHEAKRYETGSDDCDAWRQTIHVVEQVYGVGNTDQPEDSERHVKEKRSGPWERQPVIDHKGGTHDLPNQFLIRLYVKDVVDEADEKQEGAGKEHYPTVRGWRTKDQEADYDRKPDRDSAQHGGWFLVPTVRFGFGDKTETSRKQSHERRKD